MLGNKKLVGIAIATVMLMVSAIPAVSAEEGWNIAYEVVVFKDLNDETSVLKNRYVNRYQVTVKGNEYVGKRVKTLSTGTDGYQAVFSIAPGEVAHFMAFKNKATALKAKNKIKKSSDFSGVPPLKNFSVPGKSMMLCTTAGVDFENKLKDEATGKEFCTTGENGYIEGHIELSK